VRFLDFNDTWLAAEWGHPPTTSAPSSRRRLAFAPPGGEGEAPLTMKDVLMAMTRAHEVQGVTALENAFNRVGLATSCWCASPPTAVAARLLGRSRAEVLTPCRRLDRRYFPAHLPPRSQHRLAQVWAAGDASSRACHLAG